VKSDGAVKKIKKNCKKTIDIAKKKLYYIPNTLARYRAKVHNILTNGVKQK